MWKQKSSAAKSIKLIEIFKLEYTYREGCYIVLSKEDQKIVQTGKALPTEEEIRSICIKLFQRQVTAMGRKPDHGTILKNASNKGVEEQ